MEEDVPGRHFRKASKTHGLEVGLMMVVTQGAGRKAVEWEEELDHIVLKNVSSAYF